VAILLRKCTHRCCLSQRCLNKTHCSSQLDLSFKLSQKHCETESTKWARSQGCILLQYASMAGVRGAQGLGSYTKNAVFLFCFFFNPHLGQIRTKQNVGLKITFKMLTQLQLSLSTVNLVLYLTQIWVQTTQHFLECMEGGRGVR